MPNPWADVNATWYAALVDSDQRIYGVARRTPTPGGDLFEVLDKVANRWLRTVEGLGYFTGLGGITDAVPITPDAAEAIIGQLTGTGTRVRPVSEAKFDPVIHEALNQPLPSQEARNRR